MTGSLIEEAEATVRVRNVLRGVAAAAALVGSGVATNQVLDQGKLSWNWLYLAFLLSVLALLASAQPPSPPPADDRENRRGAYPRWRAYLRQVRASVADMETIGLATQGEFVLRTRQVYVDVALRRRPPHETAGDGVLGDAADRAAAGLSAVGERRPLADFLVPNRVLAVLGAPGSGKTTLVRHTALEMAERPLARRFRSRRRLPVLLYLRDHTGAITAGEPADLAEVAVAAAWLSGAVPAVWLRRWLERGRCVVLLDGLDEVADGGDRRKVVRWVTAQMARFPGNCFVVTSRPHGYLTNPLTADVLQVQRFTPDQVKAFLQTWYRAVEGRARQGAAKDVHAIADRAAEDLLARLHGTPALLDLTANPLLLTMIALVHRYRGALPGSRAELYAEICDVLLSRRQEAKNLADPTGLRGSQKEAVLRHLALHMMRRRLRDISAADAEEIVKARLSEVGGRLGPEGFLRQISTSGLLLEREHGIYSFAHLTFQEHLAAALIRAEDRYLPLLTGGVDDPWWRETTLLWAARSDATPVIDACLDSGTVRALSLAFDCADQAERLSPASRDRLDQVLDAPQDADPERLRLIAAVTASRALHDTIRLPGGAGLCTRPVTPRLWRLFAQQTGRVTTPSADTGIWATDVKNFTTWVNSLFDG